MNRTRLVKRVGLLIAGQILMFSPLISYAYAQEDTIDVVLEEDTTQIVENIEEEEAIPELQGFMNSIHPSYK